MTNAILISYQRNGRAVFFFRRVSASSPSFRARIAASQAVSVVTDRKGRKFRVASSDATRFNVLAGRPVNVALPGVGCAERVLSAAAANRAQDLNWTRNQTIAARSAFSLPLAA